ncbi:unnamed protein product [Urochloa humidicola]
MVTSSTSAWVGGMNTMQIQQELNSITTSPSFSFAGEGGPRVLPPPPSGLPTPVPDLADWRPWRRRACSATLPSSPPTAHFALPLRRHHRLEAHLHQHQQHRAGALRAQVPDGGARGPGGQVARRRSARTRRLGGGGARGVEAAANRAAAVLLAHEQARGHGRRRIRRCVAGKNDPQKMGLVVHRGNFVICLLLGFRAGP